MRFVAITLLLLTACREAPAPTKHEPVDPPLQNIVVAQYATTSDPNIEAPKAYEFAVGANHFSLSKEGRFTCGGGGSFDISLGDLPYVEELQFVSVNAEVLVLLYELSDGEGGTSRITRVYVPTCELAFTSEISGFNLGTAVLEGRALYVSAIGFVGRFDVETWGYDWTHGNLYERYKLNGIRDTGRVPGPSRVSGALDVREERAARVDCRQGERRRPIPFAVPPCRSRRPRRARRP